MRKLAAILATIALTLGLFGAAISATFSDQAIAQQQINIGSFGIRLVSDTPGAQVSPDGKTLTCPILVPANSAPAWDFVGCHVQITSVGTFAPTAVKLYAQATTAGSVDLAHFMVQFNEGAGSWSPNMFGETPMLDTLTTKTLVSTTTVVPADVYTYLGWLNLDNDDLNSIVLMTYTIEANG
jgi:hypothetical protein